MAATDGEERGPPGERVQGGAHPDGDDVPWRGCPVVGIGASAGGLEALEEFFRHMPADAGIAFVIVQHLDPDRATMLPELVAAHTSMPVRQAEDQTVVRPNQVYVIPPNKALTIDGGTLRLVPLADAHRFSIDTFFRSLADDQGENAACVILSGTGSDGTLGLREVKDRGGVVIVQTPETAAYDGMPRSAISTGLADHVVPVAEMPARLMDYFRYVQDLRANKETQSLFEQTADRLGEVWTILARHTGHDFSHYKQGTIVRRIQRRMQMLQSESVASYIEQLRSDPKEVDRLYKELLIGVTQFFRDPEAFQALAREVFPKIFEHKDARNDVRIWVPGCASGEEAYTLAVLAVEQRDALRVPVHIQIFGTDIDEAALRVARQAEFPEGIARQISPERLERFFVKKGNVYQATKEIREVCIFSPHHLIQDPPFSRIDLVSCRNVLIYLESAIQAKLLALFHYALKPNGYLLLGSSENVGEQHELFRAVDRKYRIFLRREDSAVRASSGFSLLEPRRMSKREPARLPLPREREEKGPERTLERLLLEEFAPPGVVVNAQGKIVFSSGRTGKYLELPAGAPSENVVDMARKSLRPDLRTAIHKAVKAREPIAQDSSLVLDGKAQRVKISVRPLSELGSSADLFMVVFQDAAPPQEPPAPAGAEPAAERAEGPLVARLRSELASTKEHLQTTAEELGSSNAELQSTNEELVSMNEELQSANEELQSANEELQTSQEELQSLNEELGTVNAELRQKLEQLDIANSDLQNLFRSTEIATIFLSRDLRIKKFTPAATHLFRFRENDVGRPLADITARFQDGNLVADASEVLRTLAAKERLVQLGEEHSWFMMRILPYRTVDDVIDGVVITFVDVTQMKQGEEALRRSEQRISDILASITDCYYHLDRDWRFTDISERALAFYGKRRDEVLGRTLWEVFPVDVGSAIDERYRRAVREHAREEFEIKSPVVDRWAEVHAYASQDGLSVYFRDITDRKKAEEERERLLREEADARRRVEGLALELHVKTEALAAADRRKDEFLATLGHELRSPIAAIVHASHLIDRTAAGAGDAAAVERCARFGGVVARQSKHLVRIVDDLLDISRIARGAIELRRTDVDAGEVVRRSVELTAPEIERRRHRLTVSVPDEPLWLDADPDRLEQVLANLLDNAAKYTDPGGQLQISVVREGEECVLRVADNGIGISPDLLPYVFDAFVQADRSPSRSRGGLGLGLHLVQQIVALHGGSVQARSEGTGAGSEFTVRLPLSRSRRPAPQQPPRTKTSGRRRLRVLVVEDNDDLADGLTALVEEAGHEVVAVHDGRAALEAAQAHPPDVVLLDIGLPDIDGYEIARRLRAQLPAGAKTRMVALTGYGHEDDRRRAQEAGFDQHLVKPIDVDELARILEE